jgi:hypothetical protein
VWFLKKSKTSRVEDVTLVVQGLKRYTEGQIEKGFMAKQRLITGEGFSRD